MYIILWTFVVSATFPVAGQRASTYLSLTGSSDKPVFHAAGPREAGMDSAFLFRTVDSIIMRAIEEKAFPGCQLFVARYGKVVMDSSFGHHDYTCTTPVGHDHLYDLASITKMAASTLALARFTERRDIGMGDRFSKFYPPFRGTDKE